MDNYDITGDGVRDLIVGRHDGNVEVYTYDDDMGEDSEPTLKFTQVKQPIKIVTTEWFCPGPLLHFLYKY